MQVDIQSSYWIVYLQLQPAGCPPVMEFSKTIFQACKIIENDVRSLHFYNNLQKLLIVINRNV